VTQANNNSHDSQAEAVRASHLGWRRLADKWRKKQTIAPRAYRTPMIPFSCSPAQTSQSQLASGGIRGKLALKSAATITAEQQALTWHAGSEV